MNRGNIDVDMVIDKNLDGGPFEERGIQLAFLQGPPALEDQDKAVSFGPRWVPALCTMSKLCLKVRSSFLENQTTTNLGRTPL